MVSDGLQTARQTKVVFNNLHYYEGLTRGSGMVLGDPKVVLGSYEKTLNGTRVVLGAPGCFTNRASTPSCPSMEDPCKFIN